MAATTRTPRASAEPLSFVHDCRGYDEDELERVMRENARGLLRPWSR